MNLTEEYRLSTYRDHGSLQSKEHIRLVRNELSGRLYVKKILEADKKPVFDFLKAHPELQIPKIEECILNGGQLIIIEEYIEGKSLAALLSERRLSETECAAVAVQLCRAMKPLHEAEPPVICRDLKAENIMVAKDGSLKIVDFDIARIYRTGKNRDTVLMGTAEYAAPEQFGYFQTDNRTDIYALGVLLNYMLTGRFPVERIASGPLEGVIRKCISMNPEDRYQSVGELEEELAGVAGLEPEHLATVEEKKQKKGFMIPGFRSRSPWKMCVAVIGYLFLANVCFGLEFTARDASLVPEMFMRAEQGILFLSQVLEVCLICNYRGWRNGMPVVGDGRITMRVMGYILMEFLLFFTAFLVCMLLEMLILG